MFTDELDFDLPPELIAQTPPAERSASRLLRYQRPTRAISHHSFSDLPSMLQSGDLLVLNDTRVLPARFTLRKKTGGIIEGLFIAEVQPATWRVMLKNLGAATGQELHFEGSDIAVQVLEKIEGGEYLIHVETPDSAVDVLNRLGRMPLPPYIKREKSADSRDRQDLERYQTVYAKQSGAVAAPTAGLHFTPELFDQLTRQGVSQTFVTLHVGIGTFRPVSADSLSDHVMHSERYEITPQTAQTINLAKSQGRRVIAVGTTTARVLESQPPGDIAPLQAETSIFIYPPYQWKHVDAMITNFHLPRSTLIAMIAALVGLDEQRRIYRQAIASAYRFFSYGDAMFVE